MNVEAAKGYFPGRETLSVLPFTDNIKQVAANKKASSAEYVPIELQSLDGYNAADSFEFDPQQLATHITTVAFGCVGVMGALILLVVFFAFLAAAI